MRTECGGRRGVILLVVLVMVVLLALLAASYAYMGNANLSTVMAEHHRFQARMAAESGVQRAIVMLRGDPDDLEDKMDLDEWFDNPEEFRGAVMYSLLESEGRETFREREEAATDEDPTYDAHADPVWRFNLVAPNYDEPEEVRYGITDECSKLDLNQATASQLRTLFELVIPEDADNEVDIDVLVDSLLDWRGTGTSADLAGNTAGASGGIDDGGIDGGIDGGGDDGGGDDASIDGAGSHYYESLNPPYQCKSSSFSTVEELLLVRGFTGWVVFGEDYNRNGLLDLNEDDGDDSFPPDNADGGLFPGVAPFLTVWSREMNTSSNNQPRINLNLQDLDKLEEKMEEDFDGSVISYVMDVRASGKTFDSVMNLLPAPPTPEEEEEELVEELPPESVLPEEGETSSQSDNENDGESEEGLSDLELTEMESENTPAQPRPEYHNLTEEEPPCSYEDLPLILDRLTVDVVPAYVGRINVSTASFEVLATIEELTDEELDAIVAARPELTGEEKATPAWLVAQNVLDEYKFRQILDKITTRSSVYRIESVGYADHLGVVERLNIVVEMRGPIAQVLYYRNLGSLGPSYTPHGEEKRGLKNRSD